MKRLILVVDADAECRDVLRNRFHAAGSDVSALDNTAKIAHRLTLERPALALVASGPHMDGGLAAITSLCNCDDGLPVIRLGEEDDATERIVALEWGADNVVSKPFNVDEVLVRIRDVLRRVGHRPIKEPARKPPYLFDGFKFDFLVSSLTFQERPVALWKTEYSLLKFLVAAPGKVFSLHAIAQGIDSRAPDESVRTRVRRLRSRIRRAAGAQILPIHSKGYAFYPRENAHSKGVGRV
ncbi:response regulator transcription factor [Caballeronia sp. dw_19]|uniref:response regulator transcription factor n=1 Tax=Caballeronia sp. dw_19 TaxID=2719791 RepID=UPI001BD2215B|nr:response regulator transcription factor [Caballeronia sp. dw_19]